MSIVEERKKRAKEHKKNQKAIEAKVKDLHKQGYSCHEIAEEVGIADIFVIYIVTDHFKEIAYV